MKNKEIEELLICMNKANFHEQGIVIETEKCKLLLSYIEQLEKRNKEIYDGFMATQEELSEYATENERLETEIKNLKNQVNTINNNNKELKRRLKTVQQKRDTHKAMRYRLEKNRDKAIEYLHQGKFRFWEMENILKGDSDYEQR